MLLWQPAAFRGVIGDMVVFPSLQEAIRYGFQPEYRSSQSCVVELVRTLPDGARQFALAWADQSAP